MQRLSLSYFDSQARRAGGHPRHQRRGALNEMYTSVLVNLFRDVFVMGGGVIVLLSLNARLAMVALAVMPLVAATAWAFPEALAPGLAGFAPRTGANQRHPSESFSGMRVIQLFGREAVGSRAFGRINQAYYDAAMQVLRVFAVFGPALDPLTSLALAGVVWYGGELVLQRNAALAAGAVESTVPGHQLRHALRLHRLPAPALRAAQRPGPEVQHPAERPGGRGAALAAPGDATGGGRSGHARGPAAGSTACGRRGGRRPIRWRAPAAVLSSGTDGAKRHAPPAVAFEGVWFAYKDEDWGAA